MLKNVNFLARFAAESSMSLGQGFLQLANLLPPSIPVYKV
jgi:hypothetical protein